MMGKNGAALLAKLHIAQPGARIGGSYQTLLQASDGYELAIHPDVQAVLATKGDEMQWIPFAACRNGVLLESEGELPPVPFGRGGRERRHAARASASE